MMTSYEESMKMSKTIHRGKHVTGQLDGDIIKLTVHNNTEDKKVEKELEEAIGVILKVMRQNKEIEDE